MDAQREKWIIVQNFLREDLENTKKLFRHDVYDGITEIFDFFLRMNSYWLSTNLKQFQDMSVAAYKNISNSLIQAVETKQSSIKLKGCNALFDSFNLLVEVDFVI